jgi:2-phosphoglycerate kinase
VTSRPYERYMRGFQNIRRVQKYIKSQALSHGVPTIPNYSLDQALSGVIDLVVERANDYLRERTPDRSKARHPARRPNALEASSR